LKPRIVHVLTNITHFGPDVPTRKMYTRDEVAAGIRRGLPDDRVVKSADLVNFLAANAGKLNYAILVEDTGAVVAVEVAQPLPSSGSLSRPAPSTRATRRAHVVGLVGLVPGLPVRVHGPGPGRRLFQHRVDLWPVLRRDLLAQLYYSPNHYLEYGFSFGITESHGEPTTYGCNVPGESVGQIWFQGYAGYAAVLGRNCVVCTGEANPKCSEGPSGLVGFPQPGNYKLGCSTGSANVDCGAPTTWNVGQTSP
jgi:hypothetical protein